MKQTLPVLPSSSVGYFDQCGLHLRYDLWIASKRAIWELLKRHGINMHTEWEGFDIAVAFAAIKQKELSAEDRDLVNYVEKVALNEHFFRMMGLGLPEVNANSPGEDFIFSAEQLRVIAERNKLEHTKVCRTFINGREFTARGKSPLPSEFPDAEIVVANAVSVTDDAMKKEKFLIRSRFEEPDQVLEYLDKHHPAALEVS